MGGAGRETAQNLRGEAWLPQLEHNGKGHNRRTSQAFSFKWSQLFPPGDFLLYPGPADEHMMKKPGRWTSICITLTRSNLL